MTQIGCLMITSHSSPRREIIWRSNGTKWHCLCGTPNHLSSDKLCGKNMIDHSILFEWSEDKRWLTLCGAIVYLQRILHDNVTLYIVLRDIPDNWLFATSPTPRVPRSSLTTSSASLQRVFSNQRFPISTAHLPGIKSSFMRFEIWSCLLIRAFNWPFGSIRGALPAW